MPYESYRHLQIERREWILTLMLNRPPMNPIHFDLHNELSRIFYERDIAELHENGIV